MRYLTDRKRAEGLGSAKTGTEHHWHMTVTSVLLVGLTILFVLTFGRALGLPHDQAAAYYGRPFPAIVAGLTILVAMIHFRHGAQMMIEDYARGLNRKALIIGLVGLSYAIAAVGLFAVARLAL